ncbi:MAG: toprim domain-containing protein [Bdellovibrionota bacterium]
MSDFTRVKEAVRLLDFIIQESGGRVKKKFSNYVHLEECPFCRGHECFTVYEDTYKCFQCGKFGDVITFAKEYRMLGSAVDALKALAADYGIKLDFPGAAPSAPSAGSNPRASVFAAATKYFHENLFAPRNHEALKHLQEKRGHSPVILKAFQVGFSDGALHRHLHDFSRDELLASGLVKEQGEGLIDAFPPGLFVYPHYLPNGDIRDFTCKPFSQDKTPLRLRSEYRSPGCVFLNQVALKKDEILLVEGQNDLLTVAGRGFSSVLAICGQLSGEQLHVLKEISPGKTIFLAFDQDEAGRMYTEKVIETLAPLPPTLAGILEKPTAEVRLITWPGETKDIDEYLRSQKDQKSALQVLLDQSLPQYVSLKKCLSLYFEFCEERKIKFFAPEAAKNQALMIWEWLGGEKAFFVEKNGGRCFLSYEGKVFALGAEREFRALLYEKARIVYSEQRAKIIFDALECECLNSGRRIEVSPWLHVENSEIFLHTSRPDDQILRIAPGEVTVLPNARNSLLRPSNKMRPIDFSPDVDVKGAFLDFRRLFLSNLSTDAAGRYFVASWLLNLFLLGFSRDRAILHMSGSAASGKTTAANLCSMLVYGEDWVGKSRTASDFSDGMTNPLTIKDNLESRDIDRGTLNFLLAAATGTVNQKRKGGTDSENVYERLYNQVIVTAIEPFDQHELITRTWSLEFDGKYRSPGFQKTAILEELREKRSSILSAFFLVLAKEILPHWNSKKAFYLQYLRLHHPGHAKQRLDEFLSGLFVILEVLLKYIPDARKKSLPAEKMAQEIVEELLGNQEEKAREAETHTNPFVFFLENLASELLHSGSYEDFGKEYKIRHETISLQNGVPAKVTFTGTALTFQGAFGSLGKKLGLLPPFASAQQMGSRLADSEEVLTRAGWGVRRKAVKGIRYFEFTKDLSEEAL